MMFKAELKFYGYHNGRFRVTDLEGNEVGYIPTSEVARLLGDVKDGYALLGELIRSMLRDVKMTLTDPAGRG